VSKNATCGRGEGTKKGQKLSCVKLAICPDHPRLRRPLKFCMRGRVLEVVIYFKFHQNRSRGLGAVGGRKSPSPIDLAYGLYNSLYYRTSRDQVSPRAPALVQQCLSVIPRILLPFFPRTPPDIICLLTILSPMTTVLYQQFRLC